MYGKEPELYAKRLWRNICSKMVIQFHLKDVKTAQSMYLQGIEEYGNVSKNDEHELCEQLLNVFSNADTEGLIHLQKNAQLGVFLINSVARIATKLNMNDIEPLVRIEFEEKKEQEAVKKEAIEQAQDEVTDEQLKSDAQNVEVYDDGAPNLMDM